MKLVIQETKFKFNNTSTKTIQILINPLPNDKILHLSKLTAFADGKLNVAQNIQLVLT